MGIGGSKKYEKMNIIWIDPNVNDKENKDYVKELRDLGFLKIKCFNEVEDSIDYIKQIKFKTTKIIVSGSFYIYFISKFKENLRVMNVIPEIIIFTRNKEKFIEYNKKDENIINHPYYNYGGIHTLFGDVKKVLKNGIERNITYSNDNEINKSNNNNQLKHSLTLISNSSSNKNEEKLTFEYIDSLEKLEFPLLYKSLIDSIGLNKKEQFTKILYKNYGKNDEIKKLLDDIISIEDLPIELLSKYYARLYTIESDFYKDINNDLRNDQKENYLTFIKILYEGVKLKALELAEDKILYRGSKISIDEIKKINQFLSIKKPNLPGAIVFSKSFLSFSKAIRVAKKFLSKENKDEYLKKVLYTLEKDKNLDYSLSTHADIQEISCIPTEREVLFFPFSSFEIKSLQEIEIVLPIENSEKSKKEKIYEIKLLYLGKYLKDIENDQNIINNEKAIPDSEFKNEILKAGLIKPENIKNTKQIYNQFIKFKKEIYTNVIIGHIKIDNNNLNKDIRIINSYDEYKKSNNDKEYDENIKNEKEIKDNIEIKINGEKINFSYFYKFTSKGHYKIEYSFKNNLTKTNYMFYECEEIINFDFSNFITKKITNMRNMFSRNKSLMDLDLSNWNTENVINMCGMFSGCINLRKINLSGWDTKNVTNMCGMFCECFSLVNLNLSNFKTSKVVIMSSMFRDCKTLRELNLSEFNTENVTEMDNLFIRCDSLYRNNVITKDKNILKHVKKN